MITGLYVWLRNIYPARQTHAPYYIVIYGPSDYHILPHSLINWHVFQQKFLRKRSVLIYPTNII